MLTSLARFVAYRNRDPKHNAGQAAYRNRNTTGTGFKRESSPETQRGTGFKRESRPKRQRGTGWLWGIRGFIQDPKHNVGPTYTSCRRGFKWEP
ncbi:hypothetical protein TNCV_4616611 [Trichonephila clavipes]|nr:hypothetical protein TNCV_4616611 [Trichonephila clavipes]